MTLICRTCFISVFIFVSLFGIQECLGKKKTIVIGIFLNEDDTNITEIAIQSAVNRIMYFSRSNYHVKPLIYKYPETDLFKTGQIICNLAQDGVVAIFGPESPEVNEIIQSVSNALEMPHFQTFWNPRFNIHSGNQPQEDRMRNFNFYPTAYTLAQAMATLIRENDWRSFTFLYETDEGFIRLQEVLKFLPQMENPIRFKKLGAGPDYRLVLKEIKTSGESQIILDCETSNLFEILSQAQEIKIMEEYFSYILTSMDVHTLNLETLSIKANVTAFRLLDPTGNSLQDVVRDWDLARDPFQEKLIPINAHQVLTKTALLYDALNFFFTSLSELDLTESLKMKPLSCESDEVSEHGFRLAAYASVKKLTIGDLPGPLSGPSIEFDVYGHRTSVILQIIEFLKSGAGYRLVGTWSSKTPHMIYSNITSEDREKELTQQIQGKNFRVVARLGEPYLMRKNLNDKKDWGNDRFEGYALDLVDGICRILNCTYTFEVVPDNSYGTYNPKTKKWDGLINHLLSRKADLAICDLTITYERRKAVDFTMPFMTLGISILYAKAIKEPPDLLAFTNPLSLDVWLYMATAYLLMSIIIFLVARLNPKEWENPHPCNSSPTELENIWNLKNCLWLTLGSIMAQGCDILPKGISTRMVAGMWWFFSLIMTASYTANLAAFLTMERMGPSIESAEDLASQNKIKYGCLKGGSTSSFFRDSNFSTYHRMWVQMESAYPSVFESSNKEGVKRVLTSKRKFAFIMESTAIEYEMERNCDLIQVGSLLDSKGYGIGMPTNAPYRTAINQAILKMQEMGTLHNLKNKWWKQMYGGGKCTEEKGSDESTAAELGLPHVGGVFVVLAGGIITALLIALCEFLWNVRKVAVTEKTTLKNAFKIELKFATNIWARKKVVRNQNPEEKNTWDSNKNSSELKLLKIK